MRALIGLFGIVSLSVAIYSYGFLDFNLTLSSAPLFLRAIAPLQHLVYFDRPLSANIFIILFGLLFVLYAGLVVGQVKKKWGTFPWRIFLVVIALLVIAYPMLSYDIFNYMFHGKILWLYHANPHLHAPLEYQGDLWLRFMRWVHTPSAYGPVMTLIESPAYLGGMGKFVPVLFAMKATMASFFVWCVYLIGKISNNLGWDKSRQILAQMIIAFNPFLLLELVINGHNDGSMVALFLYALYLLIHNQSKVKSLIFLSLSAGVKFVTGVTAPLYFIKNNEYRILFSVAALLLPVLVSPHRFQPWYLTWSLIPAVLIDRTWARVWIYLASLLAVYFYVPYIGTGFWNNTQLFIYIILYTPLLIAFKWALPRIRR